MPAVYSEAPHSVIQLAEELIEQYHPFLRQANIAFVFRDEAAMVNNKPEISKTTKVQNHLRTFIDYDFVVIIAEDIWGKLTTDQHSAVIEHELYHMYVDPEGGSKILPHDIEEFAGVLERYGAWNKDLFKNLRSVMQPSLLDDSTITISDSAGRVATMTGDQLKAIANL